MFYKILMIFNSYLKFFSLFLLTFLTIFTLSFSDLIIIWFFMEMTNFIFMNYMFLFIKDKKISFFYFIIQFITSTLIILSILFLIFNYQPMMKSFLFGSLLMKLGIPPLHFWMIIISKKLNWLLLLLMLTIQKIIPFYILSFFIHQINMFIFIYLIIFSTSFIPPLFMIKLTNLKILFTYSSINQSGWIIMLILMKNLFWLFYLIFYTIIMSFIIILISYFKTSYSLINYNYSMKNLMTLWTLNFMNLASLPPLPFFLFKWYTLFIISFNSNYYILIIIMIFSSFIMMYIYINMINLFLFKWSKKSKLLDFFIPSNFILYSMLMLMLSIYIIMI
nr:NADH dehydrogenase subunit 2 [Proceratium itoi]